MSAACVISSQSRTGCCHIWVKTDIIEAWSNQNNEGVWIKMFKFQFHLHTSAWSSYLNLPPNKCQPWSFHCWGTPFGSCLLFWGSPHPSPPSLRFCQVSSEGWKQKMTSPPVMLLGSCYWPGVTPTFTSSNSPLWVSWVPVGSFGLMLVARQIWF